MPLCNRVDPFGKLHATEARGLFTGNRGIIHDPETRTLLGQALDDQSVDHLRSALEGQDAGRYGAATGLQVARDGPNCFFLDEVTALAAGHRPCFYCRRKAGRKHSGTHFFEGNGLDRGSAPEMDRLLHAQRVSTNRAMAFEARGRRPARRGR